MLPHQLKNSLPDAGRPQALYDRATFSVSLTVTPAQLNAGAVQLIPPSAQVIGKYILSSLLVAVTGGAVTGLTDVRISNNENTPNDVVTILQASLSDNSKHDLQSSTVTIDLTNFLAGSAKGYQLRKTGGTMSGGSLVIRALFTIQC